MRRKGIAAIQAENHTADRRQEGLNLRLQKDQEHLVGLQLSSMNPLIGNQIAAEREIESIPEALIPIIRVIGIEEGFNLDSPDKKADRLADLVHNQGPTLTEAGQPTTEVRLLTVLLAVQAEAEVHPPDQAEAEEDKT